MRGHPPGPAPGWAATVDTVVPAVLEGGSGTGDVVVVAPVVVVGSTGVAGGAVVDEVGGGELGDDGDPGRDVGAVGAGAVVEVGAAEEVSVVVLAEESSVGADVDSSGRSTRPS